ncbi:hypothetical protein HCG77_29500 [Rhodococcus qingshengii]|jgi:hypothetical protein|nr:hypothetical protein RHOER0001_1648 [Rhodococcus erythropolis SK121]MBX9151910.1 hypothetical protein [Rhodococcus qingshengii]NDK73260.1 hypothetical protein [Rhodococcus qingshengii]
MAAVRNRQRAIIAAVPTATTAKTPAPIVEIDQNLSPVEIDVDWLFTNGAKATTVTTNAVTPLSATSSVLRAMGTAPK